MSELHILIGKDYIVGSLPPAGYLDWHEWAGVQHRGGLRQLRCGRCGRWHYPQEVKACDERCSHE